ncbi:hypothetical protein [Caballeronia grimmiae]|uniref:hypothetical protein n=1 Tax=Caballeronia grimmiae TaxID=1071679 RepID=UPI0038BDF535
MYDYIDMARGVERVTIVLGGMFIAYLGYRLFDKAAYSRAGNHRVSIKSPLLQLVVSGKAPGLFFMACGTSVLIVALLNGGRTDEFEVSAVQQPPATSGSRHPEHGATKRYRHQTMQDRGPLPPMVPANHPFQHDVV